MSCKGEVICPGNKVCPPSSIAAENSRAENTKRLMVHSVQNIGCYKYCRETRTDAVSRGSRQVTKQQTTTEDEIGLVDLGEKNAKQSIKSMELDNDGNALSSEEIETYLIKDRLYTKTDGKWARSILSEPIRTIEFDERDKLNELANLINSSNIEVIGIETVDGQKCYKLIVKPELSAARSILAAKAFAVQSSASGSLPTVSIEDLSKSDPLIYNSNISYTVWLTEDECIPVKVDAEMNFALTPASMKVTPGKVPNFSIDATTEDILLLSDFNALDSIEVPDEVDRQTAGSDGR